MKTMFFPFFSKNFRRFLVSFFGISHVGKRCMPACMYTHQTPRRIEDPRSGLRALPTAAVPEAAAAYGPTLRALATFLFAEHSHEDSG